jgi:crotonobetainyl-CoA:carnitine CoA-transferase CaiB-like acyl-CoA transferase
MLLSFSFRPGLIWTIFKTRRAPPALGAHTKEILNGELDMTDEEIEKLREIGAV